VWFHPYKPEEKGALGLVIADARFMFTSDIYGHEVFDLGEEDDRFWSACQAGYKNANLHGKGKVAIDKRTGDPVFVVMEALDVKSIAPEYAAAVKEIGSTQGMECGFLECPPSPIAIGRDPGCILAYAAVTDIAALAKVPDISCELAEAVSPRNTSPKP
jgi:hypothetical protein